MANRCANMAATRTVYLHEEGVLHKKHVLNQAIAALRRSVGLFGKFITVWKNRTRQTDTRAYTQLATVACSACVPRVNNLI